MAPGLHIGRGLELPLDAVTQTFGILAVRGAGKTNLAGVLAEQMFAAKLPFVVIDPVGVWWGLRSHRNGKDAGLAIPIFGGRHGDVPLEAAGGELLADIIVDERLSCVVDVSDFSEGEKIRFLIAFAERLYRRNEQPLHLFLEEADDYVPQRPFREQTRLLRAWENIVRRGRSRGLGMTMITQRSASLNKNVLTQIETLFVLRTTSPQDRAAIEAWLKHQGASREVMQSLPKLKNGEAWVWSPSWLETLKQIKVPLRRTFDSGATPKNQKRQSSRTLAPIDLERIRKQMADTIERAKATDPKQLRRQVAELKKALRAAEQKRVDPVLERQVATLTAEAERLRSLVTTLAVKAEDLLQATRAGLKQGRPAHTQQTKARNKRLTEANLNSPTVTAAAAAAPKPTKAVALGNDMNGALAKGERIILRAAAQHPAGCTRAQLSVLSTYKRSTRDAYIQRLREKGYLDTDGATVTASQLGVVALGDFEPLPLGLELREYWLGRLPVGEALILKAVIAAHPEAISRDELGAITDYKRSSRDAYIQRLRTRQLVTATGGSVMASEDLF